MSHAAHFSDMKRWFLPQPPLQVKANRVGKSGKAGSATKVVAQRSPWSQRNQALATIR
jgi:hypothetical protein